ncbi:hypothetical protein DSECCO2_390560 [anaerobic digester metagenome]
MPQPFDPVDLGEKADQHDQPANRHKAEFALALNGPPRFQADPFGGKAAHHRIIADNPAPQPQAQHNADDRKQQDDQHRGDGIAAVVRPERVKDQVAGKQ